MDLKQLKTRIQKTRAYQIFIVRAMKRRFSKLLYAVMIYSLLLGYVYSVRTWFPPQSLDRLEIIEGPLEGIRKPARQSLYRITDGQVNGNKTFLRSHLDKQEFDYMSNSIGDNLIISYDKQLHFFLYEFNIVREVKKNNVNVVNYDNYDRLLSYYNRDKARMKYLISIALVLLSYVYIANRKIEQ